jgi:poly-gamma-glutamate synthase PgsB/CapB
MFTIFVLFFILVLIYLLIESLALHHSLKKIPLRILVNGTRGKTTTVQIIYNIIRRSNIHVFAKTTGEHPIEYYPDGQQKVLKRISPASITENVRLIRKWAKFKPEAVILECMALKPENQFIMSNLMIKPTHILVTNILQDHLEVMGENIYDISQSISECFYNKAKILIPDNTKSLFSNGIDIDSYPVESFDHSYINIPFPIINESWELISKLCDIIDLDKKVVEEEFRAQWEKNNDSIKITNEELQFDFWNLFSVNDVNSARLFIEYLVENFIEKNNIEVIFNTRSDRPLRTKSFVPLLSEYFKDHTIFMTGSGKILAYNLLKNSGCRNLQKINNNELILKYKNGFNTYTTVIGMCNFREIENFMQEIYILKKGDVQ